LDLGVDMEEAAPKQFSLEFLVGEEEIILGRFLIFNTKSLKGKKKKEKELTNKDRIQLRVLYLL